MLASMSQGISHTRICLCSLSALTKADGDELIQHLLRTARDSGGQTVSVSSMEQPQQPPENPRHDISANVRSLPSVSWIINFDSVQVGKARARA